MDRPLAIYSPAMRAGGAERAVLRIAAGFARRGARVDLVLGRAEGEYLPSVPGAVRIVDLGGRGVLAGVLPLARYLRKERPSALLSAQDHANMAVVAARSLSRVDLRCVVKVTTTVSLNWGRAPGVVERRVPALVRWFYRGADAVVAVSRRVAEDLARCAGIPGERVHVIPNPVDPGEVRAGAAKPLDHPWFGSGEAPVVLGVGRLSREKDFPTLLRAFARLRGKARLVILGEGPERGRLESLVRELGIEKETQLPGFEANPFRFLARAAVFVLPSLWEGFPMALAEALACGTPSVATDCEGGSSEILGDGKYGPVVPVGDAAAMASAIGSMLENPPDKAALTAHAEEFSVEKVVDSYTPILFPV